ncbi:MAG: efflux transporter periplasmic adaptor subunit, partial [Lutibacter sp.]
MKKLHINSKLLVVSVLILSSCTTSKKEEIATDNSVDKISSYTTISKAQFTDSNMELGTIELQNFTKGIVTNGFIDVPPASKVKVSAIMAGFVKNSPLLIGDKVKKGQLLLTIENADFIEIQQNYLEIFEKLKYLK